MCGGQRADSPRRLLCTVGGRGTPTSRPPWPRTVRWWVGRRDPAVPTLGQAVAVREKGQRTDGRAAGLQFTHTDRRVPATPAAAAATVVKGRVGRLVPGRHAAVFTSPFPTPFPDSLRAPKASQPLAPPRASQPPLRLSFYRLPHAATANRSPRSPSARPSRPPGVSASPSRPSARAQARGGGASETSRY